MWGGVYFLTKSKDTELWAPLELKMDQFRINTKATLHKVSHDEYTLRYWAEMMGGHKQVMG